MDDAETTKIEAMQPAELLDRMQTITNRFIAAANETQTVFGRDLQALCESPDYKALEAAQPHLVKAIIDAEMTRMAEALPQ